MLSIHPINNESIRAIRQTLLFVTVSALIYSQYKGKPSDGFDLNFYLHSIFRLKAIVEH